jgi:hypothetical protein
MAAAAVFTARRSVLVNPLHARVACRFRRILLGRAAPLAGAHLLHGHPARRTQAPYSLARSYSRRVVSASLGAFIVALPRSWQDHKAGSAVVQPDLRAVEHAG